MTLTTAKMAAICAHLLFQQQFLQDNYNAMAFYSSGTPMAEVNVTRLATQTIRAQQRYGHYCQ